MRYLTFTEAQKFLGVSRSTFLRLRSSSKSDFPQPDIVLPFGGARYTEETLKNYLKAREAKAPKKYIPRPPKKNKQAEK